MFRIILLVVLTFTNLAQSKQSLIEKQDLLLAELSTTLEDINNEGLEWDRKFNQYLIDDEDPNIQLLGYSGKITRLNSSDDEVIDIANKINHMLTYESLSHKSLATIASICSSSKLPNLCNQELIFEKQYQTMSDNAFIYIKNLDLAIKDQNFLEIKDLINDMAQSKYIDIFFYPHEGFRKKLESYFKDNPYSHNKFELEKLWITHSSSPCKEQQKQQASYNLEKIVILSRVIGKRMAESIPAFRNLVETCKNNPNYEKNCNKIANIFINNSKSLISAHIGYAIQSEILKQQDKAEELAKIEKNKEDYTAYYGCLADIMSYGSSSYNLKGAEFNIIAEPIERELGEVAYFKTLAKLNYDYYFNLGDVNINNPDSCNNKPIQ